MRRALMTLLLAALAAVPAAAGRSRSEAASPAPAFELPGRDGTVSLESLRGHVVYVDFWASWCEPCGISFPWLDRMHERYASRGLVIVAINVDKDRAKANAFLDQHAAPFLVAFDPAGATAERFNVSAMPSSYLIDRTGTIVHAEAGFHPEEAGQLEALIEEAVSR